MFSRMSEHTPHQHDALQPVPCPDAEGRLEIPEELSEAFDGFPPPDEPIVVACLHCGERYMSDRMIPPSGPRLPVMHEGMWWCATPGCDAGGFGIDIFPVDPTWKDPKGLLHILEDDDDIDAEELAELAALDDDFDLSELDPFEALDPEASPGQSPADELRRVSEREVRDVAQDAARHRGVPPA